ncbi:MAG: carboxypeptidase-like regulatory domain-containing protein, partial [Bacteroidota bacterium]|nr:carboxypeptidase-like regulatory domain-containing protein [Bacteroidota bacterium]
MKSVKLLLPVIGMLLISFSGFSQKTTLSGTVTDASTGTPLEGVSIQIKSSSAGTMSDHQGNFTIEAAPGETLTVTSVGYAPQSIKVGSGSTLYIKMQQLATDLSQIVMVGSRSGGRVKTESPVPVDVISMKNSTLITGKPDLTSLLNTLAPSFNYNKQSGGDGADAIDLATLRGLGPDQTLV